jgi:hypothetical protein
MNILEGDPQIIILIQEAPFVKKKDFKHVLDDTEII